MRHRILNFHPLTQRLTINSLSFFFFLWYASHRVFYGRRRSSGADSSNRRGLACPRSRAGCRLRRVAFISAPSARLIESTPFRPSPPPLRLVIYSPKELGVGFQTVLNRMPSVWAPKALSCGVVRGSLLYSLPAGCAAFPTRKSTMLLEHRVCVNGSLRVLSFS